MWCLSPISELVLGKMLLWAAGAGRVAEGMLPLTRACLLEVKMLRDGSGEGGSAVVVVIVMVVALAVVVSGCDSGRGYVGWWSSW